jgi:putative DNA primase/helicase
MTTLDDAIEFFSKERIPMIPCHGLKDGVCTCRRGERCPSPGKHPLMQNWQGVATSDANKAKAWFRSGKPVNLAIATGRKGFNGKYLVALDGDVPDHPFLNDLKRYGDTVTQKSGSGGSHALYWSDVAVRNSCQLLDEKLDVRGSGGILVVAPSKHKSGNNYEFTCNIEKVSIQEMPVSLTEKLLASKNAAAQKRAKRAKRAKEVSKSSLENKDQIALWPSLSVSQVKEKLLDGDAIVPIGARNTTMHRILSSARAKGANKQDLESCALAYISRFEGAEQFIDEVDEIISSVLKYQPYNTSHERVNEVYLKWLEKRKIEAECPLDVLNALDGVFFDALTPRAGEATTSLTLREITELRSRYFFCKGYTRTSVYKTQLFAKKLVDIGAKRRRTAKNNLWEVSSQVLELEVVPNLSYPVVKENQMSENVKDGDIIERDGQKLKVEILKRTIPVDEHPKEHLYQGRTGIDHNLALIKHMATLTEEQQESFAEGTLVSDTEATQKAIEDILPEDFLGLFCNSYKVVKKEGTQLSLLPVRRVKVKNKVGQFQELDEEPYLPTLAEVDKARALGFLQVLWRDGKPFDAPVDKNINIVFFHPVNEEGQEKENDHSQQPV